MTPFRQGEAPLTLEAPRGPGLLYRNFQPPNPKGHEFTAPD